MLADTNNILYIVTLKIGKAFMESKSVLSDPNIGRLLVKLSVPAIIGMLVMSLYNIVDAIFIGRGVGTLGIAGVSITYPIQMIVGAVGQMFGIGGGSLLSRSLGAKDYDTANKTLGNVIFAVLIIAVPISVLGSIYIEPLLRVFGASPAIMPYAKSYLQIILFGIPVHSVAMGLNNLARSEGKAKIAMTTMILSAVINIILDALFIFQFKMGIKGAALATVIAYCIAALFLILHFSNSKSLLHLKLKDIRYHHGIQKSIAAVGSASFVRQSAMSFVFILMNNSLGHYGGDISIAVYGVILRLIMLIFTPLMGIAQGFQPIAGYNYGAKNYHKMKDAFKITTWAATGIAILGTILLMSIPQTLLRLFSNDTLLLEQGRVALRYVVIAFPCVGMILTGATLFQAMGKATQTFILTLSRQFLLLIPLVLILPKLFQLNGVWFAFPVADFLSFLITIIMVYPIWKKYQSNEIQENDTI